ncbi:MAG: hypothetical protein WB676_23955, partial [Bryobacteraceae bacterium]
ACVYSAILEKSMSQSSLESNPFQAEAWIQRGLRAELTEHDSARAEHYYLEAARVNHMFLPLWTLANFYFRQQNKPKFFDAAKRALEITPYDSRPILSEAWAMANRPGEVLGILPNREKVRFEYLNFLLANDQSDQLASAAVGAAAFRFNAQAENPGMENSWRDLLGSTEDRLIATGQIEAAQRVWDNMHRTDWVRISTPSVSNPLSNGAFRKPFLGHGFDWAVQPVHGVNADQFEELAKLSFAFDGTQPEACRLLQQFIPLNSGDTYRFEWQAESADLRESVGLKWRIFAVTPESGPRAGAPLTSPDLMSAGQSNGSWEFSVPPSWHSALVALEYERPLGQVRAEGSVSIRGVSMTSIAHSAPQSKGSL